MLDSEFAMLHAIADGRRTFASEYRNVARDLTSRGLIVTKDFPPNMRGVGSRDQGFLAELTDKGRTELTHEVDRRRSPQ
jgi:hypothetical protein